MPAKKISSNNAYVANDPMRLRGKHGRPRKRNPEINQPQESNPITISEAEAAGSVLTLTFPGIIILQRGSVPQITTDVAGAEPISAVQTAPNTVAITFDATIAAATSLTIPPRDGAIRNASGGFVTSTYFPLAA